jgi:hypothetical protein
MKPITLLLLSAAVSANVTSLMLAPAEADEPSDDLANLRCNVRLHSAFRGVAPTDEERNNKTPKASVPALLASKEFADRFATFLNIEFNGELGATPAEDAAYFLGKHVIESGLPYKDLFVGKFDVIDRADRDKKVTTSVEVNPNGLGYFRSRAWQVRYAGNEGQGLKLVSAYRILQNVTGVRMVATTNAEGADISATGRATGSCKGCHFDRWSGLDRIASVLTIRKGIGDAMTFEPKLAKEIEVDGVKVSDDATLVARLVDSENFAFNACRLSFKFLLGREEDTCDSGMFDACIKEFKRSGKIQDGLAAIANDRGFCQ